MSRPMGNGIVEMVDDRQKQDRLSWNCMDFHRFEFSAEDKSWEAYHARFTQAREGNCPYRDKCPRYGQTIVRRGKIPVQLSLF